MKTLLKKFLTPIIKEIITEQKEMTEGKSPQCIYEIMDEMGVSVNLKHENK